MKTLICVLGLSIGMLASNVPIGTVSVAELQKEHLHDLMTITKETGAKPAEEKLPDIPEGYQSKFQALVIRQQRTILELSNTVQQEQTLRQQLNGINAEGVALEKKMFEDMKVNAEDYTTQISDSGVLVVVHQPKKDVGKREEKK